VDETTRRQQDSPDALAARLKERIYVTFTALAVVLALRSHSEGLSPAAVATTLGITVAGTLLAVFVADLVSHIAVHAHLPTAAEFRHMVSVVLGATTAVLLPFVFIGVAALGAWTVDGALRASMIALLAALGVVGWLAVRRVRLPFWQKLLVLGAEVALGAAVIALELLAHG
jgi:hypothetical protein